MILISFEDFNIYFWLTYCLIISEISNYIKLCQKIYQMFVNPFAYGLKLNFVLNTEVKV